MAEHPGTLTPAKGRTVPMALTLVDPARGFTAEARMPLFALRFEHPLTARGPSETGAGRRLLLAAEARAAADGIVRMDLTAARPHLKAQSLYGSRGWVRDEVFVACNRRVGNKPAP